MSISESHNCSSLLCVLVMLLLSIAVFNIASHHDSHALTTSCNKDLNPAITRNPNNSTPGIANFAFNYTKSGGLRSTHDAACYSSNDGLIVKTNGKSVTKKQLPNSEAIDLQQIISKNVLDLNTYRPTPGSADYYNYTITVLLSSSKYRGSWTDASPSVPTGLIEVRNKIEKASNPDPS